MLFSFFPFFLPFSHLPFSTFGTLSSSIYTFGRGAGFIEFVFFLFRHFHSFRLHCGTKKIGRQMFGLNNRKWKDMASSSSVSSSCRANLTELMLQRISIFLRSITDVLSTEIIKEFKGRLVLASPKRPFKTEKWKPFATDLIMLNAWQLRETKWDN